MKKLTLLLKETSWAEPCQAQDKMSNWEIGFGFQNIDVIFYLPNIEVVFLFYQNRGCLIDIIFNLTKDWGCFPFLDILRSSSIRHDIEVIFHLLTYWGHLPFANKLRSSSIFQNIEVISQFPKYWGRHPFEKEKNEVNLTSRTSFSK